MRIDPQRRLVHHVRRGGVVVAVVHLGLGRNGNIVVMLAEERRVGGGQERGVANDDGEGRVGEEAVSGEGCGAVVEVPRPA